MPAFNKNSQQHQQMKKKLNQGQRTQKRQHFKRKYRQHMKTISDQAARQFSHSEMTQLVEDKTLSLSSSLFMKKKFYSSHTELNTDPTLFLFDYSVISNQVFKEMLLTTISIDTDQNLLEKLLNIEESLIFIRQLTQIINKLNYYKLQDEQWTYYYNLGMTENIWTGRVSKNMAIVNSMCYTYGRSKVLIEQRHKKYKKNVQQIQIDIDEHMKQMPPPISTVDMDKLMTILIDLVHKDQYELRMELERRRDILKYDAKDHQLVHDFYQLKPRQTEIHSAKIIWKAIHDEQILRYEIALFKNWFSNKTRSTSCKFQDLALTKINNIFSHLIFDQQLSSTINLTNNGTNPTDQFIENLTQQTISTAEKIAQHYVEKVNNEKKKILNNREKFKKPPTIDNIIIGIENRQMNMVQRAQCNIEQTLKSVFQFNILDNIEKCSVNY